MRTKMIACVLLLAALAPALMGPTGGFPSRPRFQAVGINAAPASTAGTVTASMTSNASVQSVFTNGSTGASADYRLTVFNSTRRCGFAVTSTGFSSSFLTNGPTGEQGVFFCGNMPVVLGMNDTARLIMDGTASGEQVQLRGTATGNANLAYIAIRDSAGTRIGYVGDDGGSDQTITLRSDSGAARLNSNGNTIAIDSAGAATVNGVAFTPTTATATTTIVGCTTNPAPTMRLVRNGNIVTMMVDTFSCTSNGTSFTLGTGVVPSGYRPARTVSCSVQLTNNGTVEAGFITIGTNGDTAYGRAGGGTGTWTGSGTKANSTDQCTFILT